MTTPINIIWLRRDLRLNDNVALFHALKGNNPVLPIFIFDRNILNELEDKIDARVQFIFNTLHELQNRLVAMESSLEVYYDTPLQAFKKLLHKHKIEKVFTNHDYEPYAVERDHQIEQLLNNNGISLHTYKDQVIFEKAEVVKDDGTPYTVFTPYSKKWKANLAIQPINIYESDSYFHNFLKLEPQKIPDLHSMGFQETRPSFPEKIIRNELMQDYKDNRDYPSLNGTSRIGLHLRFGTLSIRKLALRALSLSESFLNELIWRDFYQAILYHFPAIGAGKSFKPQYDFIGWRNNEAEFEKWCNGQTGYPIVDAGMRELNSTGFMHNRVRMIAASFLTKHLLIDWRWGEAYFAKKLLDFDFASNNGGWQWAAGSGCDAAPYFRIFNPTLQTAKFDKELAYIKKWVPEINSLKYPLPMVVHELARKRCLEVYGAALKN